MTNLVVLCIFYEFSQFHSYFLRNLETTISWLPIDQNYSSAAQIQGLDLNISIETSPKFYRWTKVIVNLKDKT